MNNNNNTVVGYFVWQRVWVSSMMNAAMACIFSQRGECWQRLLCFDNRNWAVLQTLKNAQKRHEADGHAEQRDLACGRKTKFYPTGKGHKLHGYRHENSSAAFDNLATYYMQVIQGIRKRLLI